MIYTYNNTYNNEYDLQRGVIVQPCNPSTQEAEAEELEFKANLGYLERASHKRSNVFKGRKEASFSLGYMSVLSI